VPSLNRHQGSTRFGLKVSLAQKGELFVDVAGENKCDFVLLLSWLSAPLLASRMRISGSGSTIEGTTPQSM
jgi:hypothetical protein